MNVFNTAESEVSVAFSAGLDQAWIERRSGTWGEPGGASRLLQARRDPATGVWSEPERIPFAEHRASEGDPFFEDATQTLYFVSDRPLPGLPASAGNIWRVRRNGGVWGVPEGLPEPVNGRGDEFSPVMRNGRLYFASSRDGDGDLFVANEQSDGWSVERLGPALNSSGGEWNLWVGPEEDLIVFEASGRPTNVSVPGDLYASIRDLAGNWLPAVALSEVNGSGSELNARIVGDALVWASTSQHVDHADLYSAPVDVRRQVREAYHQRLYVVNRSSHELTAVELAGGRILSRTPIGPGPHLVATARDALAVAAYGVFPRPHDAPVTVMPGWVEEEGGNVLVIRNLDARSQLLRDALPCTRPHGAAWDDTAARLWITCEDRQGIVAIRPGHEESPRLLPTGHEGAHVVAWDRAREQLLVTHTEAGGIVFLEPESGTARFLGLAPGAEALWIDDGRGQGWITLGPSGQLAVVDLVEQEELVRVDPGCGFPIDFAGRDGMLWVACFGSRELVAVDLASREVRDRIELPAGPLNVEVHPTLPVLYASLPRENRVVEVSVTGRGVTRSFQTGVEPDGLAVLPR